MFNYLNLQNMTELLSLFDTYQDGRNQKSASGKKKASDEQEAALELRNAAMMGVVNQNSLRDVSQLEGSTIREMQGQRKRK